MCERGLMRKRGEANPSNCKKENRDNLPRRIFKQLAINLGAIAGVANQSSVTKLPFTSHLARILWKKGIVNLDYKQQLGRHFWDVRGDIESVSLSEKEHI